MATWEDRANDMLAAVSLGEVLERAISVREGTNPYLKTESTFRWAMEAAGKATLGDAYIDLFDPRPLNRQVLEASGWKNNVDDEDPQPSLLYWRDDAPWLHDRGGYFAINEFQFPNDRVRLRTIGDFRRFCSLPGIEIEVVVPEDYKPNA